ncbi:MAG: CRISPR-associated protein Csx18 [Pseudanabaena sp. ELA607]
MTPKTAQVRNAVVAVANGGISLTILLIAPLGLFAVVVNTVLIMASTYGVLVASDRVLAYLQQGADSQRFGAGRDSAVTRQDRD